MYHDENTREPKLENVVIAHSWRVPVQSLVFPAPRPTGCLAYREAMAHACYRTPVVLPLLYGNFGL
jgi:hypothetical protein